MKDETKELFLSNAQRLRGKPSEHTRLCVNMINGYWRERGFDAQARVEDGRIVSNIFCGWPTIRLSRQSA